jgi:glycerol-3-phosphate O-acyltransferase
MLRSYDPAKDRDIVFIPVGVNYDRTLEDRSLLRELDPDAEKRSRWFVIKTTCRFLWKSFILIILSRWQRFGYAYVNFGDPVSVRQYCEAHSLDFTKLERSARFLEVENLAGRLMDAIKQVVPALPVALVATVMLESGQKGMRAFEVQTQVNQLIADLQEDGAHVYVSPRQRVESILNALNMLVLRRLVQESQGIYRTVSAELDVLSYYANAIAHWRPGPAGANDPLPQKNNPGVNHVV